MFFETGAVRGVDLVAVAMPFGHNVLAIERGNLGTRDELSDIGTESHGATHIDHVALFVHEVDHWIGRGLVPSVELRRVCER